MYQDPTTPIAAPKRIDPGPLPVQSSSTVVVNRLATIVINIQDNNHRLALIDEGFAVIPSHSIDPVH